MHSLTSDNPVQAERLDVIEREMDSYFSTFASMIELSRTGHYQLAMARIRVGESRRSIEAITDMVGRFEAEERKLLLLRDARADEAARRIESYLRWLTVVGIALLGASIWAAILLRHSLVREAEALRELEHRATTDELPGLANRRETLAALDRMLAAARRSGRPLALAILDIDHFKRVNDSYGHPAGDEVIRRVVAMALEVMRDQDLVGRLGGEEFVIVLPDCTADDAIRACERLRKAIGAATILLEDGQAVRITLSTGVAQMTESDDRIRLIAHADEALYRAKDGGRDRVLLAA